jgi:hypothetical protein
MVVQQRTELGRIRLLYFLTLILATVTIVLAISLYSRVTETLQVGLIVLGLIGLLALGLALLLIFSHPKRSHALLVHQGPDMIIATNAIHEGFKLRFLRDVLGDNVRVLNDDERAHWKFMEADGYYPAIGVKNPKKLLILRLCTMIFDDVFAVDASNRWEHHDSSSSAEPTFAKGEKPNIRTWKEVERA